LPRKTDSRNPADWLLIAVNRYPGFDLDDPDWPRLRSQVAAVVALLTTIKKRVGP